MKKFVLAATLMVGAIFSSPIHAGDAAVFLKSKQGDPGQYRFSNLQLRSPQGAVLENINFVRSDGSASSIPWSSVRAVKMASASMQITTMDGNKIIVPPAAAAELMFAGANEWGGETSFDFTRLISFEVE